MSDFHEASKVAAVAGKPIALFFTGADSCGTCERMETELFSDSYFEFYAVRHLILLKVNFPRREMSDEEQWKSRKLAHRFFVENYPTVVILNSSGDEIGMTGFLEGGPKMFIKAWESMPGYFDSRPNGKALEPDPPPVVKRDPPFIPIPPQVPIHYQKLALKAISGPPTHRIALINNENFYTGDTANVRVMDKKVEVTCKEIRADSVILIVEGKKLELKFSHGQKSK